MKTSDKVEKIHYQQYFLVNYDYQRFTARNQAQMFLVQKKYTFCNWNLDWWNPVGDFWEILVHKNNFLRKAHFAIFQQLSDAKKKTHLKFFRVPVYLSISVLRGVDWKQKPVVFKKQVRIWWTKNVVGNFRQLCSSSIPIKQNKPKILAFRILAVVEFFSLRPLLGKSGL